MTYYHIKYVTIKSLNNGDEHEIRYRTTDHT